MNRATFLRRASLAAVGMAFLLMVLGAWVKANGAGLSCPDWPSCYGRYLPPFPSVENGGMWTHMEDGVQVTEPVAYTQAQVWYEWLHRAVVALIIVPVAALVLATRAGKRPADYLLHPVQSLRRAPGVNPLQGQLAFTAVGIYLLQAALGALTVITGNPAWATTLHLATAVLWFATLLLAATLAILQPPATLQPPRAKPRPGFTFPDEP